MTVAMYVYKDNKRYIVQARDYVDLEDIKLQYQSFGYSIGKPFKLKS